MPPSAPSFFPFNIDEIEKGDYITPETLQEVIHRQDGSPVNIESKDFRLGVMRIKMWIEDESELNGMPLVLKCEGDGLRILTDEEAEHYVWRRQMLDLRRFDRNHKRYLQNIDVSKLSEEQQKAYSDRIVKSSILHASILRGKKEIRHTAFENTAPKMFDRPADTKSGIDT